MRDEIAGRGDAASSTRDELTRQSIIVAILLAIFCVCYFYELANFNVSIDEEFFAFQRPTWIGVGRWALQLVTYLVWPDPTTPLGPFVMFGLTSAIGYALLLRAFRVERPRAVHFALFPVFVAFPVWFNQIEFSANTLGNGFAVAACCLGALLMRRAFDDEAKWTGKGIAAAALLAFAVGIYQSFLFLHVVLGVAVASTDRDLEPRVFVRRLGLVAASAAVGFLASLAIGKLVLVISGMELSAYAEGFVRLSQLASDPGLVFTLAHRDVANIYVHDWVDFGRAGYVFLSAYVLSAAMIFAAPQSGSRRLLWLATILVIALAPFGFNMFMGGVMPVRSYVAVPAAVWCLLFFPLAANPSPRVEKAVFTIAIIVFTQILFVQSVVQAGAWAVQRRDLLLAGAIYDRIAAAKGTAAPAGVTRVLFYGTKPPVTPYPTVPTATNNASFFDWDGGNTFRVVAFMRLIGFSDLAPGTSDECRASRSVFQSMPDWPAPGSVKLEGSVVLVRLSGKQTMPCL